MPERLRHLLGVETLTAEQIVLLLDEAKPFQEFQRYPLKKASHAARQDRRPRILRAFHSHTYQLHDCCRTSGRGHHEPAGGILQPEKRRVAFGYGSIRLTP